MEVEKKRQADFNIRGGPDLTVKGYQMKDESIRLFIFRTQNIDSKSLINELSVLGENLLH